MGMSPVVLGMGENDRGRGGVSPRLTKSDSMDSVAIEQLIGEVARAPCAETLTHQNNELWEEIVRLQEENETLRAERCARRHNEAPTVHHPAGLSGDAAFDSH